MQCNISAPNIQLDCVQSGRVLNSQATVRSLTIVNRSLSCVQIICASRAIDLLAHVPFRFLAEAICN
jgi:hypothetical protein